MLDSASKVDETAPTAAACRHQEVTGKTDFVTSERKAADFINNVYRQPNVEQARHGPSEMTVQLPIDQRHGQD